ncbi:GDSL-type esterase/lipase family protein [Pseudodesulfovibrio piezophilus]|uniref:Lipolytic protein G-D-S-L family n=1 Tax=Pseudodesulfovibrio piezophilus (strain DSM 21447 / JCM 15486 / C1TLV30) TaxID=1322246 RepID=M1WN30_PSEP2|nr:GDSL-type esterase/lipase family protein [Pseudodesulfovibrio piezophilus]CCH47329.1 Lipolytic protein G-D-S-L family [Pseudodesulfovibrio piezophilus C1TLV30]
MSQGPIRIACFGDSLTEGYGLAPNDALPSLLQKKLRDDGIEAVCLNFGVSGETSTDGLDRVEAVLAAKPHGVILEFGANDCFVGDPISTIQNSLSTLIETFTNQRIPTLLVGISSILQSDQDYKDLFDPIFPELAAHHNLLFLPDILACYHGNVSLTLLDGMHPNEQGVQAIANDLYPLLHTLIAQIKS